MILLLDDCPNLLSLRLCAFALNLDESYFLESFFAKFNAKAQSEKRKNSPLLLY